MVSLKVLLGCTLVFFLQTVNVSSLSPTSNVYRNNVFQSNQQLLSRQDATILLTKKILGVGGGLGFGIVAMPSFADDEPSSSGDPPLVEVVASGDAKKLFNEGRARETQGNMEAAQRLYAKVTKISPRFIYGWSNLGNAQVALGQLSPAEESYSTAIHLCQESLKETEGKFGVRKCDDLYVLLLNRGSLRLNNNCVKDALSDLSAASTLRGKPDGIIAQNLARAKELNGLYASADRDYSLAISMTSNEVNPFWLRSALVKLQIGDVKGGFELLKRVENRFPEAPEVRAAYATFLAVMGDQIAAQRKYLEIPDIQRLKYINNDYLQNKIAWPPAAIQGLALVTSVVEKPKQL